MSTAAIDASSIVRKLKRRGQTLAVAESITGGGLGEAITAVNGSSQVFLGGIIAYSDQAKKSFLHIPKRTLTRDTAVSESVARLMAEEVRLSFGSDFAISTTGVAGPGKAYGQKAGTVWIAIAAKNFTQAIALELRGTRAEIRHITIQSAISSFERILLS
jgi:nicotinamide-nucleotide amidase